jgi:2-hydroxychromene-2-carboxylate isomerase
MSRVIEFYLDFISPFTYLALQRLPDLAEHYGCEVDYRAIDLQQAKQLAGNTGPGVHQMPIKLAYSKIDQKRWAKHYNIPVTTPAHYDSTRLARGFHFAKARGQTLPYLKLVFHRCWGEGASMIDETMLRDVALALGWDADAFLRFTRSAEADEPRRRATIAAHERGVFGVPTFVVGGELFWGNDRLDFLEEFLKEPLPTPKKVEFDAVWDTNWRP